MAAVPPMSRRDPLAPRAEDRLDRAGPVRETLDPARLEAFLRAELPEIDGPFEVAQFLQGYSNLTYLVRAGERELVLRRPPVGSRVASAHDMGREYRVLSGLSRVWELAPRPLAWCPDPSVLGAPFYVMERVRGVILRARPPAGLALGPETARGLSEALADRLADLHRLDYQAAGLGDLGRPEGYVERQVRGWAERYQRSATDPIPELEEVARWLAAHRPPESGAALIHNDFKYDNLVLDPGDLTRVRAVLDWEMATVGDPLMDLGSSLGYWVEAGDPEPLRRFRFGPTDLPGSLGRRELVARYQERTGREVGRLAFYYAFGLFKLAVIAQQIYYRHVQGLTRDERFGALIHAIRVLARQAAEVAGSGGAPA